MKKIWIYLLAVWLIILPGCQNAPELQGSSGTDESQVMDSEQETSALNETSMPAEPVPMRTLTACGPDRMSRYYENLHIYKTNLYDYRAREEQPPDFPAWQNLCTLMESRNISLSVQFWPEDQYDQELATRFASLDDLPMFCYCTFSPDELYRLAEQGLILDISSLLALSDGTAAGFCADKPWGQKTLSKALADGHISHKTRNSKIGLNAL